MKYIIILLTCTFLSTQAQTNEYDFGNTASNELFLTTNRILLSESPIREADVKYRKRVHRIIDTRIKQNRALNWEKSSLRNFIYTNVLNETITAFQTDNLQEVKTSDEISQIGVDSIVIGVRDWNYPNDPYAFKDSTIYEKFEITKVQKFRIMEDWYFDYKESEYKTKIIAIAPLYEQQFGNLKFDLPLFWLKMDDLRPHLIRNVLFNPQNAAASLTHDDFFMSRMFDSYIIKESNVNDIDLNLYKNNGTNKLSALLKSEEIKNNLFIFEHDLWAY